MDTLPNYTPRPFETRETPAQASIRWAWEGRADLGRLPFMTDYRYWVYVMRNCPGYAGPSVTVE